MLIPFSYNHSGMMGFILHAKQDLSISLKSNVNSLDNVKTLFDKNLDKSIFNSDNFLPIRPASISSNILTASIASIHLIEKLIPLDGNSQKVFTKPIACCISFLVDSIALFASDILLLTLFLACTIAFFDIIKNFSRHPNHTLYWTYFVAP